LFYLKFQINVTIKGAMLMLEAQDTDSKTHPVFIKELIELAGTKYCGVFRDGISSYLTQVILYIHCHDLVVV
jgi:hypothetical protein